MPTPKRRIPSRAATVDAHEIMLLMLYRALPVEQRAAIDRLLWDAWIHPRDEQAGLDAEKRRTLATKALKAGGLPATYLVEFTEYYQARGVR